ncbi:proline racemase family protein [Verrucomicrobiaceae bacterium R5-34]|uniref:Proline racemase family protein n=1 Tax=Oceaniferula flava TaxID=2800421 RepID=A0AAE2SAR7_9BACT|nr:proline racemase family protein [Oceaniferula flavus]MBK1831537.1 proline racemase family protein [Verrucomicrobiaceae bacterium R5-34]MBK1854224.1 proline racemase family protein [Oceaniferula flavus]MBM1135530.1 proline racemase family protein [Oceaniferula flavus]
MSNPEQRYLQVIDSHTGGEPTRMVIDWPEDVTGLDTGTMMERRSLLAERYDWIRSACINEPRGHDAMVGALLCKPVNPDCVAGIIFFNNTGYLNGCLHGTIGVAVSLLHLGMISEGNHLIETPVGTVEAQVDASGSVTVRNVPSYRYRRAAQVDVPGYGVVTGDIAWGGNWFFLTEADDHDFAPAVKYKNISALTSYGVAVVQALADQGITGADGGEIDHLEIFGEATDEASDSRNFVLCPGLEYDRSPCGTGTSAKLACLYADGKLKPGETWRQASILDTIFEGQVEELDGEQITPIVSGTAYVTGEAKLIIPSEDPFRYGIRPDEFLTS